MTDKPAAKIFRVNVSEDTALAYLADVVSGGNQTALFRRLLIEKLRTMQAASAKPLLPALVEKDDQATMGWLAKWTMAYRGDAGMRFDSMVGTDGKTYYVPAGMPTVDPTEPVTV